MKYSVYSTHSTFPATKTPSLWGSYSYLAMAEAVAITHRSEFPDATVEVREELDN